MKPARHEFKEEVLRAYPGAQVIHSDRGLLISVSTLDIAERVVRLAKVRELNVPHAPDAITGECFTVHVFGFPRRIA